MTTPRVDLFSPRVRSFRVLPSLRLQRVVPLLFLLLASLQSAVWAQEPAPLDPPGRVARLNLTEGPVSFARGDSTGYADRNAWTPAALNWPLTSGDRLWTGSRARSELHIGSAAVRMSEQTSLDFLALDDNLAQLRLAQGTLQLRVRTLFEGQRLEVDTPNLAFVISQPGDYRLDVNPASNTTRVVALSGSGVIYGAAGEAVNLGSAQQINFTGTQLIPAGPGAAWQDSFDGWAADRDRREDHSISARYVPREILGYQQLDSYGDWSQDPGYGAVWLPRAVPVNWAPYRVGHWSWISPWGWTWVDDAPWGFAPFHYGRWAQIGPRWAWVPGQLAQRPVYAPALVAFVGGNSGGVSWSVSIGSGGAPQPSVGWFPLAPGEAFRPAYRVSPHYVTQVNQNIVVNNTVNVTNIYRYQRQPGAVTAVSSNDFVQGRPVHGDFHPLSAQDLNRAQVVERNAIPQRPDRAEGRDRPRPVAAGSLPPAAVVARPVVSSRDERRDTGSNSRREAARPESTDRNTRISAPTLAVPVTAGVAGAPLPATKQTPAAPPSLRPVPALTPDHSAMDADQRARSDQQRRQNEAASRQRAVLEQAQKNGTAPPLNPDAKATAERNSALRAQQQLQRDQQRQQTELIRQQDQQRRQTEDLQGQRAVREQAQKQQEQAQKQIKDQQQQQQHQQQQQLQRARQDQQRQAHEPPPEQQKPQQERQNKRRADPSSAPANPPEGEPRRNREP